MTLLFITQRLHTQERFAVLWVNAFVRAGYRVEVLCLEKDGAPGDLSVHSMGKDEGLSRFRQILHFWKLIATIRHDRVFIHMSPVWGLLGAWYWVLTRKPVYLWYTHYKRSISVRVTELYAKRIFCATEQSVPWLSGGNSESRIQNQESKKVVVGHGIDMEFWTKRDNVCADPTELLVVHRLSRSKRLEIVIRSLLHLSSQYRLVVFGIEAEKDYVAELHALVTELRLESRVTFRGTTPMETLPGIFSAHRLILNMASETIDKTMLEAMTCGCYPVTTMRNAQAIGLQALGNPYAPSYDTPEAIAAFVSSFIGMDPEAMYRIVAEQHSLLGLIGKMGVYMREGK